MATEREHSTAEEQRNAPPEVEVIAHWRGTAWSLEFECPYCGVYHRHGGGTNPEPLYGHRTSHCRFDPPPFEQGYVLVQATQVRERPPKINSREYTVPRNPPFDPTSWFHVEQRDRILAKVERFDGPDGCWFLPNRSRQTTFLGKRYAGHLLTLAFEGIAVPAGFFAVATCGNDTCLNPAHREILPNREAERRLGRALPRSR